MRCYLVIVHEKGIMGESSDYIIGSNAIDVI